MTVEMREVEVRFMGRQKVILPVDMDKGSLGLEGVLEDHEKMFRPSHYRRLVTEGRWEEWARKQVEGMRQEFQEMLDTMTNPRIDTILEIVYPRWIFLPPEPGMENAE